MTKTEILEKIDKGLRGQGNQVDIGNVLADVLTEIVNPTPVAITSDTPFEDYTLTEAADALGVSAETLDNLANGGVPVIQFGSQRMRLCSTSASGSAHSARYITGVDAEDFGYIDLQIVKNESSYSYRFVNR